jgi:hypothetical protein
VKKIGCNTLSFAVTASLLLTLLMACNVFAAAADNSPKPIVNGPVHFDVSPPLRDMALKVSPNYGAQEADRVRLPKQQLLNEAAAHYQGPVKDGALQTYVGAPVSATIGVNLQGVGVGFPNYNDEVAPPDTDLSVGDTQVVQWVNLEYAVFDKATGAVIAGPIEGNALWSGFGGPCESNNDGDIIALWDKIAHRWLMAQNVFDGPPYYTCVAISETEDATGTFYRYQFPQGSVFPDYPKWGVWPDGYYQHNNGFGGPNSFQAEPCAYQRSAMLQGNPNALQVCFAAPTTFDDSMMPADVDSPGNLPPTGAPEVYLGSIDNTPPSGNVVYEYLFHVNWTDPTKSTFLGFGGTMPITVATFNLGCIASGDCVPQPGVPDQLEGLGDRLMYRLAYRNFGNYQVLLTSHNVTTTGTQLAERWYEFYTNETNPKLKVYQQGTYAPDASYRWMGSLAMDKIGNVAMGYSIASSTIFPSINYTGRLRGDPLGTMETEAQILAGTGSQTGTDDRWGDYSNMAIDPKDECTFWYTNEFYTTTAQFNWSTQLTSLRFPDCKP